MLEQSEAKYSRRFKYFISYFFGRNKMDKQESSIYNSSSPVGSNKRKSWSSAQLESCGGTKRKVKSSKKRADRPQTLELNDVNLALQNRSMTTEHKNTNRQASTTPSTPESERKRVGSGSPAALASVATATSPVAASPINSTNDSTAQSFTDPQTPNLLNCSRHPSRGSFNETTTSGISPLQRQHDVKGNPSAELVMNKSKNDKFHRIFKDISADEHCLKSYSCAYQGDILIQGYLYISPNWFCFYSRILGIQKEIRIPVNSVLNLTREKTAIFIPNAVGIVTAEDKYVFGSLLSRDNTYKVMHTVWKSLTEPANSDATLLERSSARNSCDEESETSLCIACGQQTGDSPHECPEDDDEESVMDDTSPEPPPGSVTPNKSPKVKEEEGKSEAGVSAASTPSKQRLKPTGLPQAFQMLRNMPKTQLMLVVCSIMVVFLACTSVILLHKIIVLQARIETRAAFGGGQHLLSDDMVSESMYYLNHERHHATIEQLHSVLKANILVLDQVYLSMKNLADSMDAHATTLQNGSHLHDET